MKKLSAIPVILALVLVLAGCGSQAAPVNQSKVLAYANPITDNLLAGFNSGDYVKFTRDFDAVMRSAVKESTIQELRAKLGQYQSRQLVTIQQTGPANDPVMVVLYKAVFSKDNNVIITISFQKMGNKEQVAGLYFK
ncbi:MAG: hypothetical protein M0Z41_14560 [Peptococcaceae bacterium]|nr:hypothetical protein [Peptococcaceae bacterium]